ncbi:MAG TPA: ATP-binding protein [Alphaproteobacteria bacterium]|nr:ATP-binding protein [Alphaproteobacteria bacterium]
MTPPEPTPGTRAASGRVLRSGQLILITLGFGALIAMTLVSVMLAQRNREAFELATRTQTILSNTTRSVELLEDAETGQRGFLLTEREAYLAPYTAAVGKAADRLDLLVVETAVLPIAGEAEKMRTLGMDKLTELKSSLDLYKSEGRGAALGEVMSDRGKNLMDEIRASAAVIRANQEQQLLARLTIAGSTGQIMEIAQVGTALLVIVISLFTGASFYRNIRALRAAQRDLASTNANLETIVEARTAALSQANEEIQKFAYIVSHDLRAPLVNIMGFTAELETAAGTVGGFIRKHAADPGHEVPAEVVAAIAEDVPEAFRFIKTSTTKMDGLISAILKLSREGRRVLAPEPLQMRPVVESIAANLKHRLDEKGAEIVVQPLPDLVADRLAIEQVFGNLLDNAAKYLAPERPGVITVRGTIVGRSAIFEIEDNGRGIAPGDHERVFELFRRSGRQDVPGEGIGLAYVRQLVYRLGGTIALNSTFGEGTIFRLSLPLADIRTQKDAA